MSTPLTERTMYIPQMSYIGAVCVAAAFKSIGIHAQPSPDGDAETYKLARKYLTGDECLPEAVTLGNFLKVTELPDYDPSKTAFLLPTSNGPCRYGHYLPLAKRVFRERNEDVLFVSPTSEDGYAGIGGKATDLLRTTWRAVVASDILRKMLLKTRPYELEKGQTDLVYNESLLNVAKAIEQQDISHKQRLKDIITQLTISRDAFRAIHQDPTKNPVRIGIVGEIFCRHNSFSNNYIFRQIEKLGGEIWISDVAEWVLYTSDEEVLRLNRYGKRFSLEMLGTQVKQAIMKSDEHKMMAVFKEDFVGYEEPKRIKDITDKSKPYLPREGANGEMVLSVGRTIWYYEKGVAGVIDISPFTCMNGIITEAVYPRLSKDLDGFPVRVFYFDGIQTDNESDVEIFLELARNYINKKNVA